MTSSGHKPRFASAGCRTSWRPGWRTASSAALLVVLVGCGGGSSGPKLATADTAPLIALAGKIRVENDCDQARDARVLTRHAIALINSGRVPAALQEQFLGDVNSLGGAIGACVRPARPGSPASMRRARSLEQWLRANSG
jgi:hypothetical protein